MGDQLKPEDYHPPKVLKVAKKLSEMAREIDSTLPLNDWQELGDFERSLWLNLAELAGQEFAGGLVRLDPNSIPRRDFHDHFDEESIVLACWLHDRFDKSGLPFGEGSPWRYAHYLTYARNIWREAKDFLEGDKTE